jgi:AcrR family transcriptional regulator
MPKPSARKKLGPKRARTTESLLDAARQLFAERGLHGATLADVAARAGMTTGAIYGNFRSKEELFTAIFERFTFGVNAELREGSSFEGKSFTEQMRQIGKAVVAFLPTAETDGVLFYEFHIYAATHPEFRAKTDRLTKARYKTIAERWRRYVSEADTKMPMERFVAVIDAMIDGLICQRQLTPTVVTDEVIMAAFLALARPSLDVGARQSR